MQELLQCRRRCKNQYLCLPIPPTESKRANQRHQICAGISNPKADGLCKGGPKFAKLWTGAPPETEEVLDFQAVFEYHHGVFDAKAAEECNADVPEKGHVVSGYAKSYNRDAFYTKAAACYIYKKLKGGA